MLKGASSNAEIFYSPHIPSWKFYVLFLQHLRVFLLLLSCSIYVIQSLLTKTDLFYYVIWLSLKQLFLYFLYISCANYIFYNV